MTLEQTLAIIKPDAVERNLIGNIISRLEDKGFQIIAMKMLHLNQEQAEGFYTEHSDKAFFAELIRYMTSAPIVVLVLQKENAVKDYRTFMGTTNPEIAENGTLRYEFAINQTQNSVHGSDSLENAQREIAYFFAEAEIYAR
ncbi:nucleoside-diphosphate kinase [Histophilus somni]|uniref:Nucleoside diphosphate kinase n=1 Tax=Histophilus somni (strain 129Pt) TaxID=205914 RepID=NDK_HISS1|nr:nucleoside-diphosphate kinase [Histophilus somni]Q0I2G6.1 RecName: Full=Nucleoside diphosphate kinase; Short=NDK; Short=NDP kinase; AltName: Full=Nucleoside-2-P kinase [Histophilus somni 129PT]